MLYPESLIKRDFENKRKANKKRIEKSMSEWKEYKLGDLYDVHNGLSKGRKFFGSGYPFLSFKTVFNNYFLPPKLSELVQANEKEQKGYNIKRGDVFVTRTSETPEELGMSSVALKDYPFATYNGFTKRLRPKDMSLVCPEFIGYYLRSPKFRALFYGLASSMSTRASLVNGDLLGMSVFLPSFETQERIASLLSSLDDKISVNKKICENLEAQAQALFKHWFIDFAPFKDGKFVESELGMIPEGWRVTTIGKVCKCELGGTPSRANKHYWGGNIAWINSGEVNKFRICQASEYITEEGLNHSATKILPAKTTVLAITGATLGQVSLLEIDSCANQSVVGITENEQIPYTFIYPLIKSRIKELMQMQTGGAQQHINKGNIQDMRIVLCPKPILSEYHSIAQELFGQIGNLCFENLRLSTLRDTLLPRLMSGQIKL